MKVYVTGGSGFVGRALLEELARRGIPAVALARSDAARAAVTVLGAEPAAGDLDDRAALQAGMAGCDLVVHAAAYVKENGPREEFFRANVQGTENVLAAARAAGVRRVVHVGTEAVLADGRPIVRADEDTPYPRKPAGLYPLTKGLAERAVRAANGDGLETVVVRPRFIWGRGDTSLLPNLIDAVRSGRWRWVAGGHYLTSTCHVTNVVEGILAAAERGAPGGVYFLTDGDPVDFRDFMTDMLRAAGADPGDRTVPRWVARTVARTTRWMKNPPISWTAIALISHEVTVVDARARRDLGYRGGKSIAAGLAELAA
ncbi:MAG TPA: NAD-dependent epimerase/dehydratase family protein [Kofleriaceae bacterium]|nr:NAD-dependent epimerase/dehydratase family protein [Kofleriaceae bacterium]